MRRAIGRYGVSSEAIQHDSASAQRPLAAIILAAGKGTRMNSELPKVVHRKAAVGKKDKAAKQATTETEKAEPSE